MTELNIERALNGFEIDWVIANACLDQDPEEKRCPKKRFQLLKDFMERVDGLIEDETMQWATEFQGALAILEKSIAETRKASRPGSIEVTIQKGKDIQGSVSLLLNGQEREEVIGESTSISRVAPGQYEVRIIGKDNNNKTVQASRMINVVAGEIAKVTLKLEK